MDTDQIRRRVDQARQGIQCLANLCEDANEDLPADTWDYLDVLEALGMATTALDGLLADAKAADRDRGTLASSERFQMSLPALRKFLGPPEGQSDE